MLIEQQFVAKNTYDIVIYMLMVSLIISLRNQHT